MALNATGRTRTLAAIMRNGNVFGGFSDITKPDIKAAVDATDDWIEANASLFNLALPQPFRGAATPQQKTLILCWVAMRRAGLLKVEEDSA